MSRLRSPIAHTANVVFSIGSNINACTFCQLNPIIPIQSDEQKKDNPMDSKNVLGDSLD